jgi:hypothetical protein
MDNKEYANTAGLLLILSGALAVLTGLGLLFTGYFNLVIHEGMHSTGFGEMMVGFFVICGAVIAILAIFPILGGIMALKKKMYGLALAGSIIGLLTIGPFFVSSILSLIGLILLVKSKDEFQ